MDEGSRSMYGCGMSDGLLRLIQQQHLKRLLKKVWEM